MRELEQWVSEWCRAGEGLKRAARFGVGINRQHRKCSRRSTRTSTTWSGHPLGFEPLHSLLQRGSERVLRMGTADHSKVSGRMEATFDRTEHSMLDNRREGFSNRVFGGLQGLTNEYFRSAGNTCRQGYLSASLQGLASGAKGPAAGVHRAP